MRTCFQAGSHLRSWVLLSTLLIISAHRVYDLRVSCRGHSNLEQLRLHSWDIFNATWWNPVFSGVWSTNSSEKRWVCGFLNAPGTLFQICHSWLFWAYSLEKPAFGFMWLYARAGCQCYTRNVLLEQVLLLFSCPWWYAVNLFHDWELKKSLWFFMHRHLWKIPVDQLIIDPLPRCGHHLIIKDNRSFLNCIDS